MTLGLVGALLIPVASPAHADGDAVIRDTVQCDVSFDEVEAELDPECNVTNVAQANGGYTLVLHGQIQDADLARFKASGVRQYVPELAGGPCFAAYLFVVSADHDHDVVWSDSVRRFTPDGKMTETCHLRATRPSVSGEQLSLWGGPVPGPGEPFHVAHGFAFTPGGDDDPGHWDFRLVVDGVEVRDSGVLIGRSDDFPKIAQRLYNFPDGMTGLVRFEGYWYASCPGSGCDSSSTPGPIEEVIYQERWVDFGP